MQTYSQLRLELSRHFYTEMLRKLDQVICTNNLELVQIEDKHLIKKPTLVFYTLDDFLTSSDVNLAMLDTFWLTFIYRHKVSGHLFEVQITKDAKLIEVRNKFKYDKIRTNSEIKLQQYFLENN